MLKTLIKRTPVLDQLARRLYPIVAAPAVLRRRKILSRLPRSQLEQKHLDGAALVLNRRALLDRMTQGGVVAELGVDQGNFSQTILTATKPRLLHLVDIWGDARYGEDKARAVAQRFADPIASGQVHISRALSLDAASKFADATFDWIYIDTDHSYATTAAELRAWAPKIKPGGFIAGHDYVMGNFARAYKYGVVEAVAEFCVEEGWRIDCLTADHTESNSFALCRLD